MPCLLSGAERIAPEVVSVACVAGGRRPAGFGRIGGLTGMMNVNDVVARASPARRASDKVRRTNTMGDEECCSPGCGLLTQLINEKSGFGVNSVYEYSVRRILDRARRFGRSTLI